MNDSVPLSLIQDAVLEFMQDREDAVVFGAQAVNHVGDNHPTLKQIGSSLSGSQKIYRSFSVQSAGEIFLETECDSAINKTCY